MYCKFAHKFGDVAPTHPTMATSLIFTQFVGTNDCQLYTFSIAKLTNPFVVGGGGAADMCR